MKLSEFIKDVLTEINSGLLDSEKITDREYQIQTGETQGIRFDIALTTTDSVAGNIASEAKIGNIHVMGAGINSKVDAKNESSEVSRVQFTVYVPFNTKHDKPHLGGISSGEDYS